MGRHACLFTVFELANRAEGEVYLGVTDRTFSDFISLTKTAPPPDIRHWRLDRDVDYMSLAFNLHRVDAASRVKEYAKALTRGGESRVIVAPDLS